MLPPFSYLWPLSGLWGEAFTALGVNTAPRGGAPRPASGHCLLGSAQACGAGQFPCLGGHLGISTFLGVHLGESLRWLLPSSMPP